MKKKTEFKYARQSYIKQISNADVKQISELLDSPIGLDDLQRKHNQLKFGHNLVIVEPFNKWKKILESFCEVFNLVLLLISVFELIIYFVISHDIITLVSAIIVFFMIIIAVVVDFTQSWQAHQTALLMQTKIENYFFVIDQALNLTQPIAIETLKTQLRKMKQSQLTIGDVVYLSVGDIVPSDCRLLSVDNLAVDQASLTGETDYVMKQLTNQHTNMIEFDNIIYADTIIKQGNCLAVIINVGINNYSSALGALVANLEVESDYEKSLKKITKLLILSILTIAPIIFVITWGANGFVADKFVSPIVFSLSIVVALIPEALPAIIASNLKLGSHKIAKNKVIVKNIAVVQNMGSVNILATDKTGTLTLDQMRVLQIVNAQYQTSVLVNKLAKISATASNLIANKVDQALVQHLTDVDVEYETIKSIDFSHETRLSGVYVAYHQQKLLIVKGSFDEMFAQIKFVKHGTTLKPINTIKLQQAHEFHQQQATAGNRIIVLASKLNNATINELVLEGFVCLEEAIKSDVQAVIQVFEKYAIDIKVLTGDNQQVSENLMHQIVQHTNSVSGEHLNAQASADLATFNLFYKLSPLDKAQIIQNLQQHNVVAFLGDGVNDSVALKQADVGISVNNACALAKHSADIIMLEKDLKVLEEAFIEGRKTFANAVKYVKITIASNFGLLLTLLVSSLWFSFIGNQSIEFLPITPIQLLLQNLIFDFANLIFVLDQTDEALILKPRSWSTKSIIPFALWNGLAHLIISMLNFIIMGYGFKMFEAITNGDQIVLQQFQTAFFVEMVWTHIMLIIVYRTQRIAIWQSRPSKIFIYFMCFFAIIPFILIGFDQLIHQMGLMLMNNATSWWYLILLGLTCLTWSVCESLKFAYLRVFKSWI